MNHRPDRVSSLIQEELSRLLVREVEFPGALVTISGVEVSRKLDFARIKVSVIPIEKEAEVLKSLAAAQGELQFKLGRKLNIKPMPHIQFEINHGGENAARVEKQLMEDEHENKDM